MNMKLKKTCRLSQGRESSILLVDDNECMRELGKECLEISGYHVTLAKNGMEALDVATKQDIDLILLDLQMPNWDGFKTLNELRQSKIKESVIALTARTSLSDTKECLKHGFNDVITKPYDIKNYTQIIERHLSHHQR